MQKKTKSLATNPDIREGEKRKQKLRSST